MGITMGTPAVLTMLAGLALVSPAAAQSWGFGVEVGPEVFLGPPPVYYEPPVVYEAPAGIYYEEPTTIIVPSPRAPVLHMEAPEDVVDNLARLGYSNFGPIDRRGALYMLTAIDPEGDLVSLEISIQSGDIEWSSVLEARYAAPPPVARRAPAAKPKPAAVPAKPAAVAARKPAKVAKPASDAAVDEAAENPEPEAGASSTLRDRLHTPKPAASEERDPEVVY